MKVSCIICANNLNLNTDAKNKVQIIEYPFFLFKKIGVPLSSADITSIANRLDRQKKGVISYR